jgi:superfamily II DNA helicase RecQ
MVDNASNFDRGIEAYHLDEHRDSRDFSMLKSRLSDVPMNRVVYLFASPQSLSSKSRWWSNLINLAQTGRISTLCIDEAHDFYQQGRNFCPEFLDAVSSIDKLLHMSICPIPLVVMSATITQHDIDPLFCILGISPSNAQVFWMPMNRRTIFFDVSNCICPFH